MKQDKILICDSCLSLTAACSQYQDNWLCDETCFRLLNSHYPCLKNTFKFTREGLNRALSAKAGPFTGPNEFSLFYAKFYTECPFSGNKRRVSYFYRQVNGMPPADPVSPLDITDELSKSAALPPPPPLHCHQAATAATAAAVLPPCFPMCCFRR